MRSPILTETKSRSFVRFTICDCSQQFHHTKEFRCESASEQAAKEWSTRIGGSRMGKMESYYLNLPLNLNTRENSYRQQQQQQLFVLHTVFRLRITFFPISYE